jgi:hypothetical protein
MKFLFSALGLIPLLGSQLSYSQAWVQDSVTVGASASQHVFYQFKTGNRTEVSSRNWQLAFSVQPSQFPNNTLQGTTIRLNNGKRVRVFEAPSSLSDADFLNLDTTGMMQNWVELNDSDSTWDLGAFNTGLNLSLPPHLGGPDYGWGSYNSTTKQVESKKKLYVVIQDSSYRVGPNNFTIRTLAKKMYFNDLVWDTAFNFVHANLDNSNLETVEISKNAYPDRFFVYYDLNANVAKNLEPSKSEWDVVFTDYYTLAESPGFGPPQLMTVTGTLSKKGTTIARVQDILPNEVELTHQTAFSNDIRTIGYDWKTHIGQGVYVYKDSLSFIVKTTDADYFVVHFTKFGGVASGQMNFDLRSVTLPPLSITQTNANNSFVAYPNPTQDVVNLHTETAASISCLSMNGQVLFTQNLEKGTNTIDMTQLTSGLYILRLTQNNQVATLRISKI